MKRAGAIRSMSTATDDIESPAVEERKASLQHSLSLARVEFNNLLQDVRRYNDRIHSCIQKEVDTVRSLPESLRHVTCSNATPGTGSKSSKGAHGEQETKTTSKIPKKKGNHSKVCNESILSKVSPEKRKRSNSTSGVTQKKLPSPIAGNLVPPPTRKTHSNDGVVLEDDDVLPTKNDVNGKLSVLPTRQSGNNKPKTPVMKSNGLSAKQPNRRFPKTPPTKLDVPNAPPTKKTDRKAPPTSEQTTPTNAQTTPTTKRTPPTKQTQLNTNEAGSGPKKDAAKQASCGTPQALPTMQAAPPTQETGSGVSNHPTTKQDVCMAHTSPAVLQMDKTCLQYLKVILEANKRTNGNVSLSPCMPPSANPVSNPLGSPTRQDVQLFTVLDTSVNPPRPRYMATLVPESTAMLRLGSLTSPVAHTSFSQNPPVAATTVKPGTHASSTPTFSVVSRAATTVQSGAHTPSTPTSSVEGRTATTVQSGVTKASPSVSGTTRPSLQDSGIRCRKRRKKSPPLSPSQRFKCDHPGSTAHHSHRQLLDIHKTRAHHPSSQCSTPDISTIQNDVIRTSSSQSTSGKKSSAGVKRKQSLSTSRGEDDRPNPKYIKLVFKLPHTPVYSSVNSLPRNFARKSTGGSRLFKRRKIPMKRMQLKLKKIPTKFSKRKEQKDLVHSHPMKLTSKAGSSIKGSESKSINFFCNSIQSELVNLTTCASGCAELATDASNVPVSENSKEPAKSSEPFCARVQPFIGHCSRTRAFKPENFQPKSTYYRDLDVYLSPSPSVLLKGSCPLGVQPQPLAIPFMISPPAVQIKTPEANKHDFPVPRKTPKVHDQSCQTEPTKQAHPKNMEEDRIDTCTSESEKVRKKSDVCVDEAKLRSPSVTSGDSEYATRLLETIARLSGDREASRSRKSSFVSPPPVIVLTSDSEGEDEPMSLVVSINRSKLSHVSDPLPCPSLTEFGVVTKCVGSFTSQGVQVERGLILDKDVFESYLTVKVGEALYDMKEKLKKTEKKVCEVMKEKERLEKVLEAKLKLIKDLTTTGLKPVFADKETMTDPVKDISNNKKTRHKLKTASTQTNFRGGLEEAQIPDPSICLSGLDDKELEEYLRLSPPSPPSPPSDNEDALSEVLPLSSKNRWMFEANGSARCSAFNLQVRFMRALTCNTKSSTEQPSTSVLHPTLLSRELCLTFTKIQSINLQLKALPLASLLSEKVTTLTSNVSHLLSHLPLPKRSRVSYDDIVLLMRLSIGGAAFNVGWKIKELISHLTSIKSDTLPKYFQAELNHVTVLAQKSLHFCAAGVRNVTVDHTKVRQRSQLSNMGDLDAMIDQEFDLDDLLSSSDEEVEVKNEECHDLSSHKDYSVNDGMSVTVGEANGLRRSKSDKWGTTKTKEALNNKQLKTRYVRPRKKGRFTKSKVKKTATKVIPKGKKLISLLATKAQTTCASSFTSSSRRTSARRSKSSRTPTNTQRLLLTSSSIATSPTSSVTPSSVATCATSSVASSSLPVQSSMSTTAAASGMHVPLLSLSGVASGTIGRVEVTNLCSSQPTPIANTTSLTSATNRISHVVNPLYDHVPIYPVAACMVSQVSVPSPVPPLPLSFSTPPLKSRPSLNLGLPLLVAPVPEPLNRSNSVRESPVHNSTVVASGGARSTVSPTFGGRNCKLPLILQKPTSRSNSITVADSSSFGLSASTASVAAALQTSTLKAPKFERNDNLSSKVTVATVLNQLFFPLKKESPTSTSLLPITVKSETTPLQSRTSATSSINAPPMKPEGVNLADLYARANLNFASLLSKLATISSTCTSRTTNVPTVAVPPPLLDTSTSTSRGHVLQSNQPVSSEECYKGPLLVVTMPPVSSHRPVSTPPVSSPRPVSTIPVSSPRPVYTPPVSSPRPVSTPSVSSPKPVYTPSVSSSRPVSTYSDSSILPFCTALTSNFPLSPNTAASFNTMATNRPSVSDSSLQQSNPTPPTANASAPVSTSTTSLKANCVRESSAVATKAAIDDETTLSATSQGRCNNGRTASGQLPCSSSSVTLDAASVASSLCESSPVVFREPSRPLVTRTSNASTSQKQCATVSSPCSRLSAVPQSVATSIQTEETITTTSQSSPALASISLSLPPVSSTTASETLTLPPFTSPTASVPALFAKAAAKAPSNSIAVVPQTSSSPPTASTSQVGSGITLTSQSSLPPTSIATYTLSKTPTSPPTSETAVSVASSLPFITSVAFPATSLDLTATVSVSGTSSLRPTSTADVQETPPLPNASSTTAFPSTPLLLESKPLSTTPLTLTTAMPVSATPLPLMTAKLVSATPLTLTTAKPVYATPLPLVTAKSVSATPLPLMTAKSDSATPLSLTSKPDSATPLPLTSKPDSATPLPLTSKPDSATPLSLTTAKPVSATPLPSMSAKPVSATPLTLVTSRPDSAASLPLTTVKPISTRSLTPRTNSRTSESSVTVKAHEQKPSSRKASPLRVSSKSLSPFDFSPVVHVTQDTKGVLIKWTFPKKYIQLQTKVKMYELYAYIVKRSKEELPPIKQWNKVGSIPPLKLPMAVTLDNVVKSKKYAFSVRALFDDTSTVTSQFSKPSSLKADNQ